MTQADSQPRQGEWFATTLWSVVAAAAHHESSESRPALEQLCRTYWPAIFAYIRSRGHGPEDACDLTQAFFSSLLERNAFAAADPAKGKFRSFLLTYANHFLMNEWRRIHRLKRGGDQAIISLDDPAYDLLADWEPVAHESGELAFDRRWAFTVLQRGMARLEVEHTGAGKGAQFQALKHFLTTPGTVDQYNTVAATLGLKPGHVPVMVHRMRERFRDLVRAEVAQTVAAPEDVEPEMLHLLAALGA